jgi:hypothetical protein
MATYHLLIHPSVNRVYGRVAPALAAAELRTVGAFLLPGGLLDIEEAALGPAPALRLTAAAPLDERGLAVVGGLAGAYVLFEEIAAGPDAGGPDAGPGDLCLTPRAAPRAAHYPDDLLTTLKYAGKTNEQFTALLVNLALAAGRRGFDALAAGERVRLLDPVCGRGTTLNQALMLGLDAVGVETQGKDIEMYLGFIRQYLRDHLIKHRSDAVTLRAGPQRKRAARRVTVTVVRPGGDDGERWEQVLDLVEDDTANVRDHCKGSSVDLVVGDLPYGVQHAARPTAASGRDLVALLRAALPGWRGALRGGGALCLGFNTRVLDRETLDGLLRENGFDIVEAVTDGRFVHRVDRTIDRDLALAVKPG